jgi:hypothetical protein
MGRHRTRVSQAVDEIVDPWSPVRISPRKRIPTINKTRTDFWPASRSSAGQAAAMSLRPEERSERWPERRPRLGPTPHGPAVLNPTAAPRHLFKAIQSKGEGHTQRRWRHPIHWPVRRCAKPDVRITYKSASHDQNLHMRPCADDRTAICLASTLGTSVRRSPRPIRSIGSSL